MSDASLRLRQGVYRILSAGFAPPNQAFLDVAADSITVFEELGVYEYSYAPEVVDMLHQFGAADPGELTRWHERLFETGIDGDICLARESIRLGNPQTGDTARLLADLRTAQESFGITVPSDRIDHAATELASMAALCGHATGIDDDDAIRAAVQRQAEFAHDHLLRWIPDLGREVVDLSPHPALRSLGAATVAFLEHERQLLPILLDQQSWAELS